MWFDSAPPPDVVTLFPPGFWKKTFGGDATVTESIEQLDPDASLRIAIGQRLGARWQAPITKSPAVRGNSWSQSTSIVSRAIGKAARLAGLAAAPRPTEFGMFV